MTHGVLASPRTSKNRLRRIIFVRPARSSPAGVLIAGGVEIPCALGRFGVRNAKIEGDGCTPVGVYRLIGGFWRADQAPRPRFATALKAVTQNLGWCDDPRRPSYNRLVRQPFEGRHEKLWRTDHLYDVAIVLDYNTSPTIHGRGSAIFLHIARDDFGPTEGCLAIQAGAMRRLLPRLALGACIGISPKPRKLGRVRA